MRLRRNARKTKPKPTYDEYETDSSYSDSDSDIELVPVVSNSNKRKRAGRSSYPGFSTPLPDAINRTRQGTTRCPTVSPSHHFSPPALRRASTSRVPPVSQQANKTTGSKTAATPRRSTLTSTAQLKKLETEKANEAKRSRELIIGSLSNQILSRLVSMGIRSRDVGQLCSERLGWKFDEWKTSLKGSKTLVYEPIEVKVPISRKRANSSVRKSISLADKAWNPSLEADALSLCIAKSDGDRVRFPEDDMSDRQFTSQSERSPTWTAVDDLSEVRTVFIHRTIIHEFLSDDRPSVLDLARKLPRVQFFAFGGAKEPASLQSPQPGPSIEWVLCAGAVIIPTFDSLFKSSYKDDQKGGKEYFRQLKRLCQSDPFIKVCLHPSMRVELHKNLEDDYQSRLDVSLLIDFLAQQFDNPSKDETKSLAEWIKLDRNVITWLSSDPSQLPDQDCDEDVLEVTIISNTLKQIQKDLYTDFRRFIIAVPEDHPYADKNSLDGIELMKISELSKVLSSPRPHLM
ncbi:hypothetical protein PSTG_03034 [Puccinia striiformis f. sp. tritici PST-78]|uniref:Uncharacterized protein n=1 Tax=Puccinia striiformis f. sp. tritici PST-78 TaxID=1165861 RepID=A0A0L0VXC0_9BASI|nr:hypothetical protein PSTG_03034 [Puccinia striiformis f. sp. tritici PST-78]